jgi:hypothetical protein
VGQGSMLKKGGSTSRPIFNTMRGGNCKDKTWEDFRNCQTNEQLDRLTGAAKNTDHDRNNVKASKDSKQEVPMSRPRSRTWGSMSRLRSRTRRSANFKAKIQDMKGDQMSRPRYKTWMGVNVKANIQDKNGGC